MNKFSLLAAVVAGFGMAGAGSATVVASGGSVSYTGVTDYDRQLGTLSKFNGAAGTLAAVTLTYGYDFRSTETVAAFGAATGSVATESALAFHSTDAAVQSALATALGRYSVSFGPVSLAGAAFDLTGTRSVYNLMPGNGVSLSSLASGQLTVTLTSAAALSAFTASGTGTAFDLYGRTLTGLLLSATGGNASAAQSTTGTASFGVAYAYDPATPAAAVPEAATWAMMLAGFGLVGHGARRRRRTARIA